MYGLFIVFNNPLIETNNKAIQTRSVRTPTDRELQKKLKN